jgi:DNA polymerase III epsilon subunit-like protein
MKNKLLFFDTETTGLGKDAEIIQIAYTYIKDANTESPKIVSKERVFKSEKPIEERAMEVHGITKEDQKNKVLFNDSPEKIELEFLIREGYIPVAHNAKFDLARLRYHGINVDRHICTMKLAIHWDAESKLLNYKLQYLKEYFKLTVKAKAHDAMGDVLVLEDVFAELERQLNISVGAMIKISVEPMTIKVMPFGKHKGMSLNLLPKGYLDWLDTIDVDPDLRYSLSRLRGKESLSEGDGVIFGEHLEDIK